MTIYFVRHGESEATALGPAAPAGHDLPLTERGHLEAQEVADYFSSLADRLTAVYASSLVRARETAEPTAQFFGLTVNVDARLNERDWGSMNSYTWTDVAEKLKHMPTDERYHFIPLDGESWEHMEKRVREALSDIERTAVSPVAIFTHGGVLRGLLPVLAGVDKSEHERFTMKTGGIARYSHHDHSVVLIR